MKRLFWYVSALVAIAACSSLPYKDDVGFLVSAQADSPEFPVYVNGHLCTDMEGNPGLCSKRIKSTDDVALSFDPEPYGYLATFRCSSGVDAVAPLSVAAGVRGQVMIPHIAFSTIREFICEGYIQPQDRPEPTSAMFSVHVIVYDAKYTLREQIQLTQQGGKSFLVLGQYARRAWVYDQGTWAQYQQEPIVEVHGDLAAVKAYSESYAMRFNFLNMKDSDGGIQPVADISER